MQKVKLKYTFHITKKNKISYDLILKLFFYFLTHHCWSFCMDIQTILLKETTWLQLLLSSSSSLFFNFKWMMWFQVVLHHFGYLPLKLIQNRHCDILYFNVSCRLHGFEIYRHVLCFLFCFVLFLFFVFVLYLSFNSILKALAIQYRLN